MTRRHPLPALWLMTDERQGEGLWAALDRLPNGAGVVFRHYRLAPAERRALFDRVRRIARRRRLMLVLAGSPPQARAWRADGSHGRSPHRAIGLRTAPAHDRREIVTASRAGADLIFVSPIFATRSHPGGRTLGRVRLGLMIRQAGVRSIALGGMDAPRARSLRHLGLWGWAAIDAWSASGGQG
jgi:thiamine-phosphate pyrophosphorylase